MRARVLPVLLVAAAAGAQPGEAQPPWESTLILSYAASGPLKGAGAGVTVLRAVAKHVAVGASVEVVRLRSSGIAVNGSPYDYLLASTLVGGTVQGRLPLGPVTPFLELTAGYVAASELRRQNTESGYGSGFGASLAAGASLTVSDHVALGLRGAVRSLGFDEYSLAMYGPWSFEAGAAPFTLGALASVRW